jgi:hypothetical protein
LGLGSYEQDRGDRQRNERSSSAHRILFRSRNAQAGFQPHFQTITSENQVQIYAELIADPQGKITTSFTALNQPLKNNRLLPKGWRNDGPYAEFTTPHREAEKDPDYSGTGASGADSIIYRIPLNDVTRKIASVRVTLNYQAIPPCYLRDRS